MELGLSLGESTHHEPPVQLDLMPLTPVHSTQTSSKLLDFPWLNGEPGSEVNRRVEEAGEDISSPNSTLIISSLNHQLGNRAISDDDEDNSMARKKLRLSKDQSAFLEESFKEQSTLNPRQKLSLAKQLNLRPRQVEVWFQNRRARTKLKQTEVDCEYLKKCCEKLTEENKRLEKELKELRALKVSQPLYKHLPPTTLSMCPSCERVSTTTSKSPSNLGLSLANPKLFSFSPATS